MTLTEMEMWGQPPSAVHGLKARTEASGQGMASAVPGPGTSGPQPRCRNDAMSDNRYYNQALTDNSFRNC